MAELTVDEAHRRKVWRVGYKPEPWAWAGWEWATNGRFPGRWDDRDGNFRTIYAGSTMLACLLEVLADFRPDPLLVEGLEDIVVDADDGLAHPSAVAGTIDPAWLEPRAAATAELSGRFCWITTHDSLAALHAQFVGHAFLLGLRDFDAAALKDGRTRELTQTVSTRLYASTELDGIRFASRHGDDLALWALFERPGDGPISPHLQDREHHDLHRDHTDLRLAFALLGLRWRDELEAACSERSDPPQDSGSPQRSSTRARRQ